MNIKQAELEYLKKMATRVLDACSTKTTIEIEGKEEEIAIHVPSGDMKYCYSYSILSTNSQ